MQLPSCSVPMQSSRSLVLVFPLVYHRATAPVLTAKPTTTMLSFGHANQLQALKMVAEREAKAIASGEADDPSYSSADIQDLPKPPYYFKVQYFMFVMDVERKR